MSKQPAEVRTPQQNRSRASYKRMLDAAQALLEEKGYEGFTLAGVGRRAKVSTGAIYARVPSKDVLFYAVHRRVLDERVIPCYDAFTDADRWRNLTTRELIHEATRVIAAPMKENEQILRACMHRAAVDERIARSASASVSKQAELFNALVLTRRDEIIHHDPEFGADIAYRMVFSTLARQIMYGQTFESQRPVEWDGLVHELGVACCAYLLGSS